MRSVILCNSEECVNRVFFPSLLKTLHEKAALSDGIYSREAVLAEPEKFQQTEFVFSTWGMPVFTEDEIKAVFPSLKCVFYAAGSVQSFARPFLNCGVKVFSAWGANAIPVAEYAVSQIILANKGFFAASAAMKTGNTTSAHEIAANYKGNYGASVGLIGAGMIGKLVIRMLKNYCLSVKVFDPFLSDEKARELGVEKCTLEEIFSDCTVVSNHLANNEQTKGMLNGALFSRMQPYAAFINTGRGAQVVESDLAAFLKERPDVTALLDVTYPEPPVQGHAFYSLPNCILTPHIAGSSGQEVHRMAQYMLDEYVRFEKKQQCLYEVTPDMLATMA